MANQGINNLKQEINNVSDNDNPADYNQMAQLWGEHYQTTENPEKMSKFQSEMQQPTNPMLMDLARTGASAFGESETDMSNEDFTNLLYHTMFHESGAAGGIPRDTQGYLNKATQQWVTTPGANNELAASYAQMEPSTLFDLVNMKDAEGNIGPSKAYYGPAARKATMTDKYPEGVSYQDIYNTYNTKGNEGLRRLLIDNPKLGAVAAGAKYAKSFKAKKNKPVEDTMAAYNKVEDAFNY